MNFKYVIFSFLFTVMLMPLAVNASYLEQWTTNISLGMDKTAEFEVMLVYNETITRSDYFFRGDVSGLTVFTGSVPVNCGVEPKIVGTSILCSVPETDTITYKFRTDNTIEFIRSLKRFSYKFQISQITGNFTVTVRLPSGFTLVPDDALKSVGLKSFEPSFGSIHTDGTNIFIQWSLEQPELGKTFDASIIYEKTFGSDTMMIVIVALLVLVSMVAVVIVFRNRTSMKSVLPVLDENERKVMELLLSENKETDQRKIVRETGFSKSRISRIIKDLEERGLIETRKVGRTNRIKLSYSKEKKKESREQKEEKEIKNDSKK